MLVFRQADCLKCVSSVILLVVRQADCVGVQTG